MFTKEEAYAKIADLVERFSLQIDSYKKSSLRYEIASSYLPAKTFALNR